jgi:DnaJ-domain-containing protein 1
MSLSRRLRRLVRAELRRFRDDPLEGEEEEAPDAEAVPSTEAAASSDAAPPDVPPDVAEAYRALEVPVGSGREAVKKGYRRVMKKYHQDYFRDDPDKHEVAGEVSKRLNDAYDRVLDYLDARDA